MATQSDFVDALGPEPGTLYRCRCGVGAYGKTMAAHLTTHENLTPNRVNDWVEPEEIR